MTIFSTLQEQAHFGPEIVFESSILIARDSTPRSAIEIGNTVAVPRKRMASRLEPLKGCLPKTTLLTPAKPGDANRVVRAHEAVLFEFNSLFPVSSENWSFDGPRFRFNELHAIWCFDFL